MSDFLLDKNRLPTTKQEAIPFLRHVLTDLANDMSLFIINGGFIENSKKTDVKNEEPTLEKIAYGHVPPDLIKTGERYHYINPIIPAGSVWSKKVSGQIFTTIKTKDGETMLFPNCRVNARQTTNNRGPLEVYGSNMNIISIVGEYGKKFAAAEVEAGRKMLFAMHKFYSGKSTLLDRQSISVFQNFTFQRNYKGVLNEALQTVIAASSILTSRKVEGFENPLDLFRQIKEDGVLDRFAAGIIFGQTAQTVLLNKFPIPSVSLVNKNAHLQLSPEWIDIFRESHLKRQDSEKQDTETGRGCPVAVVSQKGQPSAISIMTDNYLKFLEKELEGKS